MSERDLHLAVAEYLDLALTPATWWTTIPLGSGGRARGGQLKARGVKAGTPDILLIHDGRAYWIELKMPRGQLSAEQLACKAALAAAGSWPVIARTVEHVEAWLEYWKIPTNGKVTIGG